MDSFFATYAGWGTVMLRICIGVVFIVHGWSKVKNPAGIAGAVWGGFKPAGLLHGLVEVVGGAALIAGLWINPVAAVLAVIMLGAAYYKVRKWHVPFTVLTATGWEFDLVLFAGLLALLLG